MLWAVHSDSHCISHVSSIFLIGVIVPWIAFLTKIFWLVYTCSSAAPKKTLTFWGRNDLVCACMPLLLWIHNYYSMTVPTLRLVIDNSLFNNCCMKLCVIASIIKVEIGVICQSRSLRIITQTNLHKKRLEKQFTKIDGNLQISCNFISNLKKNIYLCDNYNVRVICLFWYLASSSQPVIYEARNEKSNGTQVVEKCRARGERLARINNSKTLGEVKNFIKHNKRRYWTGLRWDGPIQHIINIFVMFSLKLLSF